MNSELTQPQYISWHPTANSQQYSHVALSRSLSEVHMPSHMPQADRQPRGQIQPTNVLRFKNREDVYLKKKRLKLKFLKIKENLLLEIQISSFRGADRLFLARAQAFPQSVSASILLNSLMDCRKHLSFVTYALKHLPDLLIPHYL